MSRRAVAASVLFVGALSLLAVLLAKPRPTGASALSPSPRGWRAARRYLEERGASVGLRAQPWNVEALPRVIALGFPAHRSATREEVRALETWLYEGGVLLLGYSGAPPLPSEASLMGQLDLTVRDVGGPPPWSPAAWRAHVDREWRLLPDARLGPTALELRVKAQRFVPAAPREARVMFRAPGDVAAAFEVPRGAGRIVVLPAEVLANQRLREPGHADLLEQLHSAHPGDWSFDEYHHGLGIPATGPASQAGATFDAFLLQIALLYAAALLAAVRRFGPAWADPPLQAASTAAFLRGLGVQHDRRKHHASAARLLVDRVQALHPRMKTPAAAGVNDARSLVGLARVVGRMQGGRQA